MARQPRHCHCQRQQRNRAASKYYAEASRLWLAPPRATKKKKKAAAAAARLTAVHRVPIVPRKNTLANYRVSEVSDASISQIPARSLIAGTNGCLIFPNPRSYVFFFSPLLSGCMLSRCTEKCMFSRNRIPPPIYIGRTELPTGGLKLRPAGPI